MSVSPVINPAGAPWMDYSDFWWNPQEPGTGLMVWHDVKTAQFLAAYFGYGTDGKSYWFTLQGGTWQRVQHGQSIGFRHSGTLYESNGTGFASPNAFYTLPAKAVGTGGMEFTDAGNGTFSLDITGVATKTMPITRFNP